MAEETNKQKYLDYVGTGHLVENIKEYVDNAVSSKVDKVDGKSLSTNDYTTEEKNKLSVIEEGANRTIVDSSLSTSSENPVQNKVVKQALDEEIARSVAVEENLQDQLDTLIDNDADKSVRTIANEELAAQLIPESARESLDTLQEIATWIQTHPDDAAAMNLAIENNATAIETEETNRKAADDLKVDKTNAVMYESVSMGRTEGSEVGELSVALGNNLSVFTKESAAFGGDNIVGQKGYYVMAISFDENYIWLNGSMSGVAFSGGEYVSLIPLEGNFGIWTYQGNGVWYEEKNGMSENINNELFVSGYELGDMFNLIVPDNHYVLCGTITEIVGNRIKYEVDTAHYSYSKFNEKHIYLTEDELKARWEASDLTWTSVEDAIGADDYTFAVADKPTVGSIIVTRAGFSSGVGNKAAGGFSNAEGADNTAAGNFGHVEGQGTTAGYSAHAEGYLTQAIGKQAHAEGNRAIAHGVNSHAEGAGTLASGNQAHAEGEQSKATMTNSHAEGGKTTASGHSAHSEGWSTVAGGASSHAEGENTKAIGHYSHSEGYMTTANGQSSHVEGGKYDPNGNKKESVSYTYKNGVSKTLQDVVANGHASHVEGGLNQADGNCSHVEGYGNFVASTGKTGHAEGWQVYVSGESAHGEGYNNAVTGNNSHVEGYLNQVLSANSHGEGKNNIVNGSVSHAEGEGNIVNGNHQHVQGKYNSPLGSDYLHIVGNGESDSKRSNAHTLDKNGNAWYAGTVKVGGTSYSDASEVALKSDVNEAKNIATGKADKTHTHTIADITNLQDSLDSKSDTSHTHSFNELKDRDNIQVSSILIGGAKLEYDSTNERLVISFE